MGNRNGNPIPQIIRQQNDETTAQAVRRMLRNQGLATCNHLMEVCPIGEVKTDKTLVVFHVYFLSPDLEEEIRRRLRRNRTTSTRTTRHRILTKDQLYDATDYEFLPLKNALNTLEQFCKRTSNVPLVKQYREVLLQACRLRTRLKTLDVGSFVLYRGSSKLMFRRFSVGKIVGHDETTMELHQYAARGSEKQAGPKPLGFRRLLQLPYEAVYLNCNDRRLFLKTPTPLSRMVTVTVNKVDILTGSFMLTKEDKLPNAVTQGIQQHLLVRLSHFREKLIRGNRML